MEDVMLEQARQVLRMEAEAVLEQVERIDEHFKAAVEMIMACPGRTVITGMGKSGIIGRKMAATLASTGTPSFYLHPAEGIHGDLGMVTEGDVVIALSNSGETGEVLHILPSLRRIGAKLIAMVGNPNSTLAKNSDIVLNVGVTREACPLGLAPTSSTTAALAYGDALALALLSKRKFTASQFAVFHPGGSLGRKLLLTVEDIMHSGTEQQNAGRADRRRYPPRAQQRRGLFKTPGNGTYDGKPENHYQRKTGCTGFAYHGKQPPKTDYGTAGCRCRKPCYRAFAYD